MGEYDTPSIFGFIHPVQDVHTLGILSVAQLLEDCGLRTHVATRELCECLRVPMDPAAGRMLRAWIEGTSLDALGFSYRLDPGEGIRIFAALYEFLEQSSLVAWRGGRLRFLAFAGLPAACDEVALRFPRVAARFRGDESPLETLSALHIPIDRLPAAVHQSAGYDSGRRTFAQNLIASQDYRSVRAVDRSASPTFGIRGERLVDRIDYGLARGLPPLIRAHAGPWLPDRREAVSLFLEWCRKLARGGLLDILSIGTSQLSQSRFGEDWAGAPDGGGVPINSPEEYGAVWSAARPMLVRTYAGTKDVPTLARMYEERLDIAWHALSLWWFCRLDGRGPNGVLQNLQEHFSAMRFIAGTGKPLEPNIPHHFAFRGGDDLSYIVPAYLAAAAAKRTGIRYLVLQVMLTTPRSLWGIQDLARARVLLSLVRSLEDRRFRVFLQPRGGLDYFSPDPQRAQEQLAEVTALMDDIEPQDATSPQIIHVVSYSEGSGLADPGVIEESIQITRYALTEYRRLRKSGLVEDMSRNIQVHARAERLMADARRMITHIESHIDDPFSPQGLYEALASGYFALPWLTECRDEFPHACAWKTRMIGGGMEVVDEAGKPIPVEERLARIEEWRGGSGWKRIV